MFCCYSFNPRFIILVFSVAQVIDLCQCNQEDPYIKKMDDITTFDSETYCKFQANSYKCGKKRSPLRYYYNVDKNSCEPFEYGNCKYDYNVFSSLRACKRECRDMNNYATNKNVTENIYCRFQPEFGNCHSYHPKWYFDITQMTCRGFSYSGCGGNHNRFELYNECLEVCSSAIKHT